MSHPLLHLVPWLALTLPLAAAAADSCSARSGAQAVRVVELYTSEGCSSCPPADRWLSALKGRPDVVALAFHVSYWDRLGWKDRFASPAYTRRQAEQQRFNGARYSYTPQVVVDGVDEAHWHAKPLPGAAQRRAPVQLSVARDGATYLAQVQVHSGAPQRLAAIWVLTENDHKTAVKSGENEGATLAHDFVVRELRTVAEWPVATGQSTTLQFRPQTSVDALHPRELNLVVLDAASGRPVQAVKVSC
jgi:hypothetical protein